MAKKTVKQRKRGRQAGVSPGPKRILTDEMKKEILADTLDHSKIWVAKKYRIGTLTVGKLISENPMPPKITAREELDPLKRTELLAMDSTKVLEYTIHSMKSLLEAEIQAKKDNPEAKPTITVKDLKDFFETVAPYVLQKADSVPLRKVEKTPMAKVHNMFAKKQDHK